MLERAAGCLENAGRRFFRDSNGAIRHPRSLYSTLGQPNGTNIECLHLLLTSLQAHASRCPNTLSASSSASRSPTANDTRTPALDFLYPPHTQEFASSCLLHHNRRLALRRRRRRITPGLSRNYASEATRASQPAEGDQSAAKPSELKVEDNGEKSAKKDLLGLLADDKPEMYEQAWLLYVKAGHPADLDSALLALLSHSENIVEYRRARRLFDGIDIDCRSSEDYDHMVKASLAAGKPEDVTEICQEAASRDRDALCSVSWLAHLVQDSQWELAKDIWESRPKSLTQDQLWSALYPRLSDVPDTLLSLSTYVQDHETNDSARSMARFLLDYSFKSLEIIENAPTGTLLLLLRKFHSLSISTSQDYFDLMKTLQSSQSRSIFIRSMLIYRNFRWLMPDEVPKKQILMNLLTGLVSFQITTGIQFLLSEFRHFYEKPPVGAYKSALVAYSREADLATVSQLFERLVADHGRPRSRRLLAPLLQVHAQTGNVQETTRLTDYISKEYAHGLNSVCWNILMNAYVKANDPEGCFSTFKKMLKSGARPDSYSFGTLMGICAKRGDVDLARQLLSLAQRWKVQVTGPMVDTLVEAYCNNGRLDLAESVAKTCLGFNIKGSTVRMWNLLLWNYAFKMDLESVSRIRSLMDERGIQPDGMTYSALMLSLVLIGQTNSARRILRTLHRSHRMFATEFHYAIILYGYVRDRNRDMVHIIFREIQERFDRAGCSSSLLVLRSHVQRDLQLIKENSQQLNSVNVRLESAEKFLRSTIADFNFMKLASKEPLLGRDKQPAQIAFPANYYEQVISAYGITAATKRAEELFDEFIEGQRRPNSAKDSFHLPPLRLLSALMLTHMKSEKHHKVDECWNIVFPRAQELGRPSEMDEWVYQQLHAEPPRPSVPMPANGQDVILKSDPDEMPKSIKTPILPALRFMLSRPLSLYMRSLAYRNEPSKMVQVIAEVEEAGFVLSTFNWSTFVQMLTSSESISDQFQAFATFEQKFMPNFPGWRWLVKSFGVKPPGVPSGIDAMETSRSPKPDHLLGKVGRRYWMKVQPDFMQPTYVTMVYLAASLISFRERSINDGGLELARLYEVAPKTIDALADMPYLREKFQGVLLRKRQEQGDKNRVRPENSFFVWTGGVLGVHGQPRVGPQVDQPVDDPNESQEGSQAGSQTDDLSTHGDNADGDIYPEGRPPAPEKTVDSQDMFDIQAESFLETRRRLSNIDVIEELLDDEFLQTGKEDKMRLEDEDYEEDEEDEWDPEDSESED